ncbi:MAG: hypothetical protein L6Q38_18135, partial [Nitrospira sp.]|nr:hypothetical protein [Nitrospira sp.]
MNASFTIVRFSPNPEEVEHVNVALLLWDGQHRLVYDASFPKLSCIAPGFDARLLSFYLQKLESKIHSVPPGEAARILGSFSSQLQILGPRELTGPPFDATLRVLIDKYLSRQPRRHRAREGRERVESKVEQFLSSNVSLPADAILRRARPDSFLAPETVGILGVTNIHITRVISGERHLVLLEGLDLRLRSAMSVGAHANKVSYNYYLMGKIADDLKRIEHRQLHRATVLFGAELA